MSPPVWSVSTFNAIYHEWKWSLICIFQPDILYYMPSKLCTLESLDKRETLDNFVSAKNNNNSSGIIMIDSLIIDHYLQQSPSVALNYYSPMHLTHAPWRRQTLLILALPMPMLNDSLWAKTTKKWPFDNHIANHLMVMFPFSILAASILLVSGDGGSTSLTSTNLRESSC